MLKKKYLRHVAVGSGSFLCGFDSFYAVPAHFKAFLELTFKSDANPDPTALFIKKVPRFFLIFQSGNLAALLEKFGIPSSKFESRFFFKSKMNLQIFKNPNKINFYK